ncbi:hypothetical protein [Nocardiopsis lambiniae]|uniref:Uncharacterized protein n=1 Tax=Nocardiopsis lambiniae TaxID=3075539 RepID=A0ABU2M7S0_9ACTN|nr:hypothetical protein [Nocardiopsis sp. DSM 44743]MDT0328713.1 hypothetical protein [Nocardiopsis sp. DSM 44743]
MSTSENTTPADDSTATPAEETTTEDGTTAEDTPPGPDAFLAGVRPESSPRVLSAETFALTGLLLILPVVATGRLFELFGWFALTDLTLEDPRQAVVVNADLVVAGGLSVLAVLSGSLSLIMGRATNGARRLASATVLTGALFVVLAIVTYVIAAGRI